MLKNYRKYAPRYSWPQTDPRSSRLRVLHVVCRKLVNDRSSEHYAASWKVTAFQTVIDESNMANA